MRLAWIVPVAPRAGGAEQGTAGEGGGRVLDEVAEREDVPGGEDVAAQAGGLSGVRACRGSGVGQRGQGRERERGEGSDRQDESAQHAGIDQADAVAGLRAQGLQGDHGRPQPRNIWEVVESIWSAAVTTLEFIS